VNVGGDEPGAYLLSPLVIPPPPQRVLAYVNKAERCYLAKFIELSSLPTVHNGNDDSSSVTDVGRYVIIKILFILSLFLTN
jgi:hypothetical protein